ncbi:hypothetical protein PMAYCL1PPCAC_28319, partial [Pristionchus mayeri]
SMSAHPSENGESVSHEEHEELKLEEAASPELNEEELLGGGEEEEEEDEQPRGDTAHLDDEDMAMDEDNLDDFDENDGVPDLAGEEHMGMEMDDEEMSPETDEHHAIKESEGSEEPENSRQSSTRSSQPRSASMDEEDEMLEDEEDDEEGGFDGEKKKGKDSDHPVLLAQSGEGTIHVGVEYQATIAESAEGIKMSEREDEDRDTALWLPPPGGLNEDELVEFCEEAMGIYMLSFDRALYILQNSGYDYKKALATIAARKPVREEWSDEDNQLFRQAYALYGKNFQRIRQTMPHRSMCSIIHHYYSTKKQQDYKSLVDSKVDRIAYHPEDQMWREFDPKDPTHPEGGKCDNCQETVSRLFLVDETKQCNTCMLFFKLALKPRPVPLEDLPEESKRRRGEIKLAADCLNIVEDFIEMAEHMPEPDNEPETKKSRSHSIHMGVCVFQSRKTKVHEKMREIEQEMTRCRTRTIRIEQAIKTQRAELADRANFDKLRAYIEKPDSEKGRVRMQYTWTDQERITAFHCFVRYGRDFEAVAEVVGTKTPDMVKSLYAELKDDIDKIIDDAEEEDENAAAAADRDALLGHRKETVEVVDLD